MSDLERVENLIKDKKLHEETKQREHAQQLALELSETQKGINKLSARIDEFANSLKEKIKITFNNDGNSLRVSFGFYPEEIALAQGVIVVTAWNADRYTLHYQIPENNKVVINESLDRILDEITKFSAEILLKPRAYRLPSWYTKIGNAAGVLLGFGTWIISIFAGGFGGVLLGWIPGMITFSLSTYLWLPIALFLFYLMNNH